MASGSIQSTCVGPEMARGECRKRRGTYASCSSTTRTLQLQAPGRRPLEARWHLLQLPRRPTERANVHGEHEQGKRRMSASSVLASVWIDRCFWHALRDNGLATTLEDDDESLRVDPDKIAAPATPAVTTPGLITAKATATTNVNLPPSETSMSSVRNHRILIASLFLPTTAVLGPDNSQAATPTTTAPRPSAARLLSSAAATRAGTPGLKPHPGHLAPFKSIVDDLRDKVRDRFMVVAY